MLCVFKVIQNVMNRVENVPNTNLPKKTSKSEIDFLFHSMSDETFLDLIREKIEYLIDEGYKYSEQLAIINRDSGRNIAYSTYTRFVKMYIMEDPQNLFQMREFHKYYSGYAPMTQAPQPQMQPQVIIREEAPKPQQPQETERPREEFKNEPPKDESTDDLRKRLMEARRKSKGKAKPVEEDKKEVVVESLKKGDVKIESRGPLYQHEAMPDKDNLY
jgi:hypothetical protein